MNNSSRIAIVVEGALCAALSVVLGYLTVFRMPQGGSINLELVPILIFAYRRGWKWGIEVGVLVGLLSLMLGGYVVHPVQAILDYPLASGALGLSGVWRKRLGTLITGTIIGGILCYCCSVISGVVFFASYAPEGSNVLMYSITYNSFFLLKLVINTIIAMPVFGIIERIHPIA